MDKPKLKSWQQAAADVAEFAYSRVPHAQELAESVINRAVAPEVDAGDNLSPVPDHEMVAQNIAYEKGMWVTARVTSRQVMNPRLVWAKSESPDAQQIVFKVNNQHDWRPNDQIEGTVSRVDGVIVMADAAQGGPRWNKFGKRSV
jgi:hypothetical protein